MIKRMFTALFAVVLVLSFSTVTLAQDKADVKKKEMKEKQMQMKEMKTKGGKTVSCDPMCGFKVTSHDEAELTGIVKKHAKGMHSKEMSDADVKGMMKTAGDYEKKDMYKKQMMKEKEMKKEMKEKKDDDGYNNL